MVGSLPLIARWRQDDQRLSHPAMHIIDSHFHWYPQPIFEKIWMGATSIECDPEAATWARPLPGQSATCRTSSGIFGNAASLCG
jgi:hypothetical protein